MTKRKLNDQESNYMFQKDWIKYDPELPPDTFSVDWKDGKRFYRFGGDVAHEIEDPRPKRRYKHPIIIALRNILTASAAILWAHRPGNHSKS